MKHHIPHAIHIMTAGLRPGDAISNFMITSKRLLSKWGAKVYLYADHVAPEYGAIARLSRYYPNTGRDLLWFHYSIYADNLEIAAQSHDFKVMDFHGISPPELFAGQNEYLARLCRQGLEILPALRNQFDAFVVHSEYSRQWLVELQFDPEKINKIFLTIDTSHFSGSDAELAASLTALDYFLMVGRIVPQKDVLALLNIYSHIQQQQPETALVLVGSRHQAPGYQKQIDRLIAHEGLQDRVLLTGQVNNSAVLQALFTHATLLFVTSEWESFCVPIAESLYFGVPAVVHRIPPLPEIAGRGGLVIDKSQPAAAAAQVVALLNDEERYWQMRRAAKDWASQYSVQALAETLDRLFQRLAPTFSRRLRVIG